MAPIPAVMTARSHTVGEPRWSPNGRLVGWLDSWDGRTDLVIAAGRVDGDGGPPPAVVTATFGVTPAGAYGGGGWCWLDDDRVVVAGADGQLAVVGADGSGVLTMLSRDGSAFAPAAAPDASAVAFCVERDDACDIAIVPADGSQWPQRVSTGADYCWDPAWAPDSVTIAWHEWDLPAMSWDASRIAVRGADGAVRVVAGGDGVSVGQPRFAPTGDHLAYVCDRGGSWNVWVARADGSRARPLRADDHDHAEPAWGPGQRSYAWSPAGDAIAWCRNEAGFGRLMTATVQGRGAPRAVAKAHHRGIDWGTGGLLAVRSGARTPAQVVVTDADDGARRVLARGPVAGYEALGLVEPEAVTWRSGNATVHGLLYRPERSALGAGAPPLFVHIHGGPTGQAVAEWSSRIAHWVSRGWAVLAPNYRGSTGYGRTYWQALERRWGERDVADVAAGIRHAVRRGWCDPERVVVAGGSAGGLTVLMLCAQHGDLVRAGVSLFGVTDLFDLVATTHRFESRYLDRLVGLLPDDADRYRAQSPITWADQVKVPVLVLQGADDKAVPRAQADAMVDAMRRGGAPVEYQVYEGEGHGFRRLANVIDEFERTEAFLERWVLQR